MPNNDAYYKAIETCFLRYADMAIALPPAKNAVDLFPFLLDIRDGIDNKMPLMKLNRWLGYIQGVLIERGFTTVETERNFTRPLFRPLDYGENV